MNNDTKTRTVKTINIDADKCNGCRACEVICSAFHAMPKYSSNNPARSRVRVVRDPLRDIYVHCMRASIRNPNASAGTNT
nr:hypothetical protein [Geotalea toluenoxydans]